MCVCSPSALAAIHAACLASKDHASLRPASAPTTVTLGRPLQPVSRSQVEDGFREECGHPPGDVVDGHDPDGMSLLVDERHGALRQHCLEGLLDAGRLG